MYQCQLKLKEREKSEDMIKHANTILQKEELEETVDKVHSQG